MSPDVPPMEEPLAELERRLLDDYIREVEACAHYVHEIHRHE